MITLAPSLNDCLALSAVMFCCGIFCVLARKSTVSILMGVELILNAANVNLIAFATFLYPDKFYIGHCFAIFVIVIAASETAVFLALLLALFQQQERVDVDDIGILKG
jgi:NADH:ubiquinone oxidoreductase subunit K